MKTDKFLWWNVKAILMKKIVIFILMEITVYSIDNGGWYWYTLCCSFQRDDPAIFGLLTGWKLLHLRAVEASRGGVWGLVVYPILVVSLPLSLEGVPTGKMLTETDLDLDLIKGTKRNAVRHVIHNFIQRSNNKFIKKQKNKNFHF